AQQRLQIVRANSQVKGRVPRRHRMAGDGASSGDPFRLPGPEDELKYPLGNGLIVRYGFTNRLIASSASVLGDSVTSAPPTQGERRMIYFAIMDYMGTTISVLRVAFMEGLKLSSGISKIFVVDRLETLLVYRRQGLATSLLSFLRGIADAHNVAFFCCCQLADVSFWERLGFLQEASPELNALVGFGSSGVGVGTMEGWQGSSGNAAPAAEAAAAVVSSPGPVGAPTNPVLSSSDPLSPSSGLVLLKAGVGYCTYCPAGNGQYQGSLRFFTKGYGDPDEESLEGWKARLAATAATATATLPPRQHNGASEHAAGGAPGNG
ncbi:unnamed protein product, partial [Discosporangium mesarthrocarpum]